MPGTLAWAERIGALVTLLLLFPGLAIAAAAIWLLSARSPLIAHARVGRFGGRIWVLKLRTMWSAPVRWRLPALFEVERIDGAHVPASKKAPDARVTSGFAALCRRYSIDELPQLWNVLRGEMSLVGPRPLTAPELRQWYGRDAHRILLWKPGLTGLWQIKGRSALSYRQRRRLDLFLVKNWSLALYFRILMATVPRALSGDNAS
jgi:lipopolysaccharide/colanic/teichoic acid biosynthesis glycosyltransferase